MTSESRTEIIIFSGLAAFAVGLWWLNRQAGAGSGLDDSGDLGIDLPGLASGGYSAPAGAANTFNIGGLTLPPIGGGSTPAGGSTCGCPTCNAAGSSVAFGSQQDLVNWLDSQNITGALLSALQPGGYN